MNHRSIGVVVDDGLLAEMRVIILCIQFQRLAEQGDIERRADAVVPRLFLLQVVDDQLASTGQQIVVLCQRMNGTITLTCRQAQVNNLVGHQLQMETRCHKRTVTTAMVNTHTSHCHHLVVQVVGVLGVGTGGCLFFVEP